MGVIVERIEVPDVGEVVVERNGDWSGDALVRFPDDYIGRVISVPGKVLAALASLQGQVPPHARGAPLARAS